MFPFSSSLPGKATPLITPGELGLCWDAGGTEQQREQATEELTTSPQALPIPADLDTGPSLEARC